MQISGVSGQCYGVFGLGKTGIATARALQQSGANVFVWDDGETARAAIAKKLPEVTCSPIESWPWEEMAELVLSPGVPLTHPSPHRVVQCAREHDVPCIGDIELLCRANPNARYIAITGTNGKSTTTSLIAHVLSTAKKQVQVGGNLGMPVLDLAPLGEDGIYVLELSSYQLELLKTTRFNVAVWLNISPDHLDRHGDMAGYIAAKAHIFERQQQGDTVVIGVDDAASEAMARTQIAAAIADVITIATQEKLQNGVQYKDGSIINQRADVAPISLKEIRTLAGQHNGQNAAAAYAACMAAGVSHDAIAEGLKTFPGLAHRMQWLGALGKVGFVNDSKATNADAAEKALLSYNHIYWIVGGVAKAGGIAPLAIHFSRVRQAYLIGEASQAFAETLDAHAVEYHTCGTLENAVQYAYADASASGEEAILLLSPACASFDQFANFEARGDAFIAEYDALKSGGAYAVKA